MNARGQQRRGRRRWSWAGLLLLVLAAPSPAGDVQQMLRDIQAHSRAAADETGIAELDPAVLKAMARVPRAHFVPEHLAARAHEDRPLPIGHGQTISQPYIVALMTHLLQPRPEQRVLEIGTGSGYQAAILGELVREVYSIEIVPALARESTERLQALGYARVRTRQADGYYGWPEQAPFDGIMVTAAASGVPPPLIAQLKPGGRMLIPVGGPFALQNLLLIEKQADGSLRSEQILPVRFVPLTGTH
jgi:protein-L-isoaspartate(D-aspartate) O-methyltransferase